MMQHLIGENRSIGGSQHGKRTQSRITNRSTHPTFMEETPALTPNAMLIDIEDELRQARNGWNSLPADVQDGWTFDKYLNYRAAMLKQTNKHSELQ